MPGVGHVPGQIFACLAAAEDENVHPFRLSHDDLLAGAASDPDAAPPAFSKHLRDCRGCRKLGPPRLTAAVIPHRFSDRE
jgi:hypothetical protein